MRIKIKIGKTEVFVALTKTPTAEKIWKALPFESRAEVWGQEVYFPVPVSAALESGAREVVEPGTVCFWTQGSCLALPYGPTPVSKGSECRLADPCNMIGKLEDDPQALRSVCVGDTVRAVRATGNSKHRGGRNR